MKAPSAQRNPSDGQGGNPLDEVRVLIVEDEFLVALEIEEMLVALGCHVVATVPDFGGALQAVNNGGFDVALLDVNLNGEESYPAADQLIRRGVPFMFATGYTKNRVPDRFRHHPCIQKPIDAAQLRAQLLELLKT